MTESEYQSNLKSKLKELFPGCMVLKNDPNDIQGIPDLMVLYKDKWASLEVKENSTAKHRPNQDYRVEQMNNMSFASFIYRENKETVIYDMERLFTT